MQTLFDMISNCVAGRVVRRMDETIKVCSFSCGEEYSELNSFIVEDATFYQRELLAVTYLMEDLGELIAYFSLANDRIGIEDFDSTNLYNKFRRKSFVNAKRIKHYPAVKICRLGVCEEKQQSGIGTSILDFCVGHSSVGRARLKASFHGTDRASDVKIGKKLSDGLPKRSF